MNQVELRHELGVHLDAIKRIARHVRPEALWVDIKRLLVDTHRNFSDQQLTDLTTFLLIRVIDRTDPEPLNMERRRLWMSATGMLHQAIISKDVLGIRAILDQAIRLIDSAYHRTSKRNCCRGPWPQFLLLVRW